MFCNVAVEVFHTLLGQGRGGGMGCVEEGGTGARWGADDTGFVLFRSVRGGRRGFVRDQRPDALARRTSRR
jgi:hypothetical protein